MWNALPMHPFMIGATRGRIARPPTQSWRTAERPLSGTVGRVSRAPPSSLWARRRPSSWSRLGMTPAAAIRHPANGGARAFAQGMEALREGASEQDERATTTQTAASGAGYQLLGMNLPIGPPASPAAAWTDGQPSAGTCTPRSGVTWRAGTSRAARSTTSVSPGRRRASFGSARLSVAPSARRRTLKMQRGRRDPEGPVTRTSRHLAWTTSTRHWSECHHCAARTRATACDELPVRSSASTALRLCFTSRVWRGPWSVPARSSVFAAWASAQEHAEQAEGAAGHRETGHRSSRRNLPAAALDVSIIAQPLRHRRRNGRAPGAAAAAAVHLPERDASGERATDQGCRSGTTSATWRGYPSSAAIAR
jgi:hypothetical protein